MSSVRRKLFAIAAAAVAIVGLTAPAHADKTLRAVMHSDLKILDPIWTTAYIVRNHGYMIYDTLFATDEKGEIKPQMVDKYDVSADQLTHTFTLRDGLLWHDGQPVTAEDCVASIKRWAAKDATGQKLMTFVASIEVVDAKTFVIKLKEPTGLLLLGLGKALLERSLHDAQARGGDRSQHADLGLHRFRPLRLQARRVEARRQDGLRQVRQVQAAPRARLRSRGRQSGESRSCGMARHLRPSAGRERAAGGRDRSASKRRRTTCCPWPWPMPTSSTSTGTHSATSTPSGPIGPPSHSTTRRSAKPCSMPSIRRIS